MDISLESEANLETKYVPCMFWDSQVGFSKSSVMEFGSPGSLCPCKHGSKSKQRNVTTSSEKHTKATWSSCSSWQTAAWEKNQNLAMTSNLQLKRFFSDLPLSQLLDFFLPGYLEVKPFQSIQIRILFTNCKSKFRKYLKPRRQIKKTHFPWNLSKRSVHSTFSFQSSVTGCCSPGSLWPCRTKQHCMESGVDNSQYVNTLTQ